VKKLVALAVVVALVAAAQRWRHTRADADLWHEVTTAAAEPALRG
jgi:hypothetical protein